MKRTLRNTGTRPTISREPEFIYEVWVWSIIPNGALAPATYRFETVESRQRFLDTNKLWMRCERDINALSSEFILMYNV